MSLTQQTMTYRSTRSSSTRTGVSAYKYYVNQGGKHKEECVRMAVHTKFRCHK
ncbi:hypothetical protein ACP70R_033119 [Stipagrostis hirtigluma subsp. patula]